MRVILILAAILATQFAWCADYYWVGNSGNWSDFANHWATTSGGNTFHTSVPTSIDDVHFDANSFTLPNQTVTVDPTIAFCKNFDWTGVANYPTFAGTSVKVLKIYGSLILDSRVYFAFRGDCHFNSTSQGNIIKMAGNGRNCDFFFEGIGGEWILQDSLKAISSYDFFEIYINAGTFRSNGNFFQGAVNMVAGNSTLPRTMDFGTSSCLTSNVIVDYKNRGATVLADSCKIYVRANLGVSDGVFAADQSFNEIYSPLSQGRCYLDGRGCKIKKAVFNYRLDVKGTNMTFDTLIIADLSTITRGGSYFKYAELRGNSTISGNNVFGDLTLFPARSYTLEQNRTQTIEGNLNAYGQPGFPIEIVTSNSANQATINKVRGVFCGQYLYLIGIKAKGLCYAGIGSDDAYNNTDWVFGATTPCNYITYTELNIVACDSFTASNGSIYTTTDTFDYITTGSLGWDSIMHTNLTINNSTYTQVPLEGCDSLFFDGVWLFSDADVFDTLSTVNQCDSVVHYEININSSYRITVFDTIGLNETYILPGGNSVTAAGIYVDTMATIFACDSIINTHLFLDSIGTGVAGQGERFVDFGVYPSAVVRGDNIYVVNKQQELVNVEIYNLLGQVMSRQEKVTNPIINTSDLTAGLYLIRIQSSQGLPWSVHRVYIR